MWLNQKRKPIRTVQKRLSMKRALRRAAGRTGAVPAGVVRSSADLKVRGGTASACEVLPIPTSLPRSCGVAADLAVPILPRVLTPNAGKVVRGKVLTQGRNADHNVPVRECTVGGRLEGAGLTLWVEVDPARSVQPSVGPAARNVPFSVCKVGAGPENLAPTQWVDEDRFGPGQPWVPVARNVPVPVCKFGAGPENVDRTRWVDADRADPAQPWGRPAVRNVPAPACTVGGNMEHPGPDMLNMLFQRFDEDDNSSRR
jgi:hypothetical protein